MNEDMAGHACDPREDVVPGLGRIVAAILGSFVVPRGPRPQGTLHPVCLSVCLGQVPGTLPGYLLCCGSRGGSAFGEQVQVGNCLQEVGTRSHFLESCATWLPDRGRSTSLYPGPEPGSSAPGRVWSLCSLHCPGEGSSAASQGQCGRPSGVGEGPRVGAGGSGERALGILSSPSTFAERSSYSGALKSMAWQPFPVRIQ